MRELAPQDSGHGPLPPPHSCPCTLPRPRSCPSFLGELDPPGQTSTCPQVWESFQGWAAGLRRPGDPPRPPPCPKPAQLTSPSLGHCTPHTSSTSCRVKWPPGTLIIGYTRAPGGNVSGERPRTHRWGPTLGTVVVLSRWGLWGPSTPAQLLPRRGGWGVLGESRLCGEWMGAGPAALGPLLWPPSLSPARRGHPCPLQPSPQRKYRSVQG